MTTKEHIGFFFKPESIALIGASPNPEKLSYTILESLLNMGFQGKIYPVNPGYQEIRGLKCYPNPGEIEGRIDIAIFAVPAPIVLEILDGPVENIKGAIIVSSGFREIGPEGKEMETRLKEILDKTTQFFKDKKIDTARLDAELLISHALKIDRMGLYLKYDQVYLLQKDWL